MSNMTLTNTKHDQATAVARPNAETDDTIANPTRRRFLKLGAGALSALALLEIGGAGLSYLQPRNTASSFGSVITAGLVDEFPLGSVTEFVDGRFYLIRTQDGGFLALYRRCPHLGCTVNWQDSNAQFICPCHASSFDLYGNFNNTPVPRPLDTFPIAIEDQKIRIDTSQLIHREQFSPEQLTYA